MSPPGRPDGESPEALSALPHAWPAADPGAGREALRQQWLLAALRGESAPPPGPGWLGGSAWQQRQGLQVYRANAAAHGERALASAYPTVRQLLGPDSFAALASAHWHRQPPERGDLAAWGAALPLAIAQDEQLAGEPYLGDVARLDWALHQADRAADDDAPPEGLAQLAQADPAALVLRFRAGHAVLVSPHPLHTLWAAHQHTAADRFEPVRQALADRRAEAVRVRRQGWQVLAECIDGSTAGFELALLQGQPIATAITRAGAGFAFEPWFMAALRHDSLAAVLPVEAG